MHLVNVVAQARSQTVEYIMYELCLPFEATLG
jgi:hypothetical protein